MSICVVEQTPALFLRNGAIGPSHIQLKASHARSWG